MSDLLYNIQRAELRPYASGTGIVIDGEFVTNSYGHIRIFNNDLNAKVYLRQMGQDAGIGFVVQNLPGMRSEYSYINCTKAQAEGRCGKHAWVNENLSVLYTEDSQEYWLWVCSECGVRARTYGHHEPGGICPKNIIIK